MKNSGRPIAACCPLILKFLTLLNSSRELHYLPATAPGHKPQPLLNILYIFVKYGSLSNMLYFNHLLLFMASKTYLIYNILKKFYAIFYLIPNRNRAIMVLMINIIPKYILSCFLFTAWQPVFHYRHKR